MFNLIVSNKDELIRLSRDANPQVRAAAIRELGRVTDADFAPILLDALEDSEWMVRVEAVKALANQGTPVIIPALQPRLEDDSAEVRQVTREAIRSLRQKQRTPDLLRGLNKLLPQERTQITWPTWMGKVEISFATVASLFMMLSTIRFLTVNAWADNTTGDVLWNAILICLILGIFFFVFVIAGVLQVHLRMRDAWSLLKEKPWRRLVEFIFVIDVASYLASDLLGQVIFLISLTAGVPLAIAFFVSEIYAVFKKRLATTRPNP